MAPSVLSPCTSPTVSSYSPRRSSDALLASRLIVRNTFLDFPNESRQELPQRRRARSLEVARTSSQADVECTIANVGVGSGSADVTYSVGQSVHELRLPFCKPSEETATEDFAEKFEEQICDVPSVGSMGHRIGNCVPCGYFWKSRGCLNGSMCEYCHLCDAREKKRRQKAKKRLLRTKA